MQKLRLDRGWRDAHISKPGTRGAGCQAGPLEQGSGPGNRPLARCLWEGVCRPRGDFRDCGLGQGSAETNPGREFEGSGPGGSGMDVVASLTPKPRGSPCARRSHSTLQKGGREAGAARSGARDGCAGWGRMQTWAPAPETAQGWKPCRTKGGRLTPAAERLHGEDAPPAQHGPAPPRPLQPNRALPARVPPPLSHSLLSWCVRTPWVRPPDTPSGGGVGRGR